MEKVKISNESENGLQNRVMKCIVFISFHIHEDFLMLDYNPCAYADKKYEFTNYVLKTTRTFDFKKLINCSSYIVMYE